MKTKPPTQYVTHKNQTILIGIFLMPFRLLTGRHIKKSGSDNGGHGPGICTVYPEERSAVHGETYFYVGHPMYLGAFYAALAFPFFRNNLMAILTALIFLIPVLSAAWLEDKEMMERFAEEHKEYIKNTRALLPHKSVGGFLKLLFSFKSDK